MAGKICVITSVVQGNGSKYIATNLATDLKRREKDSRILLVDFDFDNPFLATAFTEHDDIHGIDELSNCITSEGVAENLFLENVVETKLQVDVLKGTKFIEKNRMFTKQHIESILERAKDLYDFIYVVVNANSSNAGTIYSLLKADKVMMTLRNNHSNLNRLLKTLNLLKQYSATKEFYAVYNYKNLTSKLNLNKKFEGEPVQIAGVLEYDEKGIDNLNLEKKDSAFSRTINQKEFTKINKMIWGKEEGAKK